MKVFLFSLISALFLTACSGGSSTPGTTTSTSTGTSYTPASYTGITSAASIDSDTTADAIGSKTAEATIEAITQETAQSSLPGGISIISQDESFYQSLINLTKSAINDTIELPTGVSLQASTFSTDYTCGTIDVDDELYTNYTAGLLNGTATLNNVCYQDLDLGELILNGSITFTQTVDSLSIQFTNFSVNDGTTTQTIDMTVSCDFNTSCSFSSDYIGDDEKTYRLENLSITGSGTGPYYVDATFYHPDFGSSTLTTTNAIYFNCANGQPSAGTIQFSGANGSSGSITFNPLNDCNGYSGTWDNTAAAVPPAPTGGTYSGSWLN